MKTMILAAFAMLALGAGSVHAEGEGPSDGGFSRAAATIPQAPVAGHSVPHSRSTLTAHSYIAQSRTHDAWQLNGLNGGGG